MGKRVCTSPSVPLTRFGHSLACAGFLRSIGAPVDSSFQRAHLPLLCANPNAYVPVHSEWLFYEDMSKREVEADVLGWEVGRWAQDNNIHLDLINSVATAPTLCRALMDLSALVSMENSHLRIGIIEHGEDVLFYTNNTFGVGRPGHYIGLSYSLMVIIAILRHFTGANWQPREIGIKALAVPGRACEILPDTRIITGQKLYYVRFPRTLLSLPPERQWAFEHGVSNAEEPQTFTQKLN